MTMIRGVSDAAAKAAAARAKREFADPNSRSEDADRAEWVCFALRQVNCSDEFRAKIAHAIIDHPTTLFGGE